MPIVIRAIKQKKKGNMGEEKISPKKNMGMDSMMPKKPKKKATYKYGGGTVYKSAGGKVTATSYKGCGANIVGTK
jgi:hypothetical protein